MHRRNSLCVFLAHGLDLSCEGGDDKNLKPRAALSQKRQQTENIGNVAASVVQPLRID